jgi:DNA modification methylase
VSDAVRILIGDVREGLRSLPERSVHCVVTSPPYWGLRDYGVDGQIGLEATPEAFVETMVEVFREVRRVMRDDATLWLNLGDSYAGGGRGGYAGGKGTLDGSCDGQDVTRSARMTQSRRRDDEMIPRSDIRVDGLKPKDLCMVPWRVALALQADGWWLRSIIAWHKRSPMPESCTDRPTSSWEPIFLLAKRDRYFYDAEAVKERSSENTHSRGAAGRGPDEAVIGYKTDAPGSGNRNNSDFQRYMGDRPPEARRNMRNVWTLSSEPYSEAHFAVFPSEIPRRAIKAGTSEKGCCPHCGTPWERQTEKTKYAPEIVAIGVRNVDESRGDKIRKLSGKEYNEQSSSRTIGWKPGCACPDHQPVPCVVLDPFLGSGTTVAAARQLGRHGVGCELNPSYAELARVRIGKAEKPHTFVDTREPEEGGLFK